MFHADPSFWVFGYDVRLNIIADLVNSLFSDTRSQRPDRWR